MVASGKSALGPGRRISLEDELVPLAHDLRTVVDVVDKLPMIVTIVVAGRRSRSCHRQSSRILSSFLIILLEHNRQDPLHYLAGIRPSHIWLWARGFHHLTRPDDESCRALCPQGASPKKRSKWGSIAPRSKTVPMMPKMITLRMELFLQLQHPRQGEAHHGW